METLWSVYALALLFSVDAAHSHKGSKGITECVQKCNSLCVTVLQVQAIEDNNIILLHYSLIELFHLVSQ